MGGHGRVKGQAVDVAERGRRKNEFQGFHKTEDLFFPRIFDLEGNHPPEIPGSKKFPGQLMVGMAGQARIIYPGDAGMSLQPTGDLHGIQTMLAHTQREGLQTPVSQPGLGGAQIRSGHLDDLVQGCPIFLRGYDGSPQDIPMPADVLGRGVHAEIYAMFEGLKKEGSGKGIIHDHLCSDLAS